MVHQMSHCILDNHAVPEILPLLNIENRYSVVGGWKAAYLKIGRLKIVGNIPSVLGTGAFPISILMEKALREFK